MSAYLPAATPWTIALSVVLVCFIVITLKLQRQNGRLKENLLEFQEKMTAKEEERDTMQQNLQELLEQLIKIQQQRDKFKQILTTGSIAV